VSALRSRYRAGNIAAGVRVAWQTVTAACCLTPAASRQSKSWAGKSDNGKRGSRRLNGILLGSGVLRTLGAPRACAHGDSLSAA